MNYNINELNKQPVVAIVFYILIGISLLTGLFLLKALILMKIFNWFAVTLLSLKEINIWVACVIGIVLECIGGNLTIIGLLDGEPDKVPARIGTILFKFMVIFLGALVLHNFFIFPV